MSIVTVGEAMVELRQAADGFAGAIAGDAFNTAAWLAAAGRRVRHVQDLGEDVLLDRFRHESARRAVELVGRLHPGRSNGVYFVSVDAAGERRFQYHRAGSAAGETLTGATAGAPEEAVQAARLVYVTGVTLAISAARARLVERLRSASGMLAVGLNLREGLHRRTADGTVHPVSSAEIAGALRETLPAARIVFGAVEEVSLLAAGSPAELAAQGRVVVVTDGARGATAWAGGRTIRATPDAVHAVDTSGAGDALAAAFLDAHLAGRSLEACLEAGVAAGACAVSHRGALPPLSTT